MGVIFCQTGNCQSAKGAKGAKGARGARGAKKKGTGNGGRGGLASTASFYCAHLREEGRDVKVCGHVLSVLYRTGPNL